MGCGGSKGGKGKVDLKINPTKIPEFDEMFDSLAEPLGMIADLKDSVDKAQAKFEKACHVGGINDHALKDALWVMLTTCSAAVGGDFKALEISFTMEPPFVEFDIKKVDASVHDILNGFEAFVEACVAIGEKAEPLVDQIKEAVEKCAEFPGKAMDAAKDADLGLIDGAMAVKNCASNIGKIGKAPKILAELL